MHLRFRHGQAAVEYMALVAFSLAILSVIGLYVNSSKLSVDQELQTGFARQTVDRVADAVRLVMVQGPPAKLFVDVTIPEGVVGVRPNAAGVCNATEILLQLSVAEGGTKDVYHPLTTKASGDLSFLVAANGPKRVTVEAGSVNGQPCVILSG